MDIYICGNCGDDSHNVEIWHIHPLQFDAGKLRRGESATICRECYNEYDTTVEVY